MLQFLYRNHVTPYPASPSTFRRRFVAKKYIETSTRKNEPSSFLLSFSRLERFFSSREMEAELRQEYSADDSVAIRVT